MAINSSGKHCPIVQSSVVELELRQELSLSVKVLPLCKISFTHSVQKNIFFKQSVVCKSHTKRFQDDREHNFYLLLNCLN